MEELSLREANRGQLLVITALALAVLLAVLTLALNTAVYGEVYVAQTDDGLRAERGVLHYQNGVRRGVAGVVARVNARHVEYDALRNGLAAATGNWSGLAARAYARDDVATNATLATVSFRTRIVQNASATYTDQSGNTSWTVAEDVSDVRGYDANVSRRSLARTDNCTGGAGCFSLSAADGDDVWRMEIYNETGSVVLAVETANGTTANCTTSASQVRTNLTEGTFDVGGTECSFPTFREDPALESPYTLTYANADNASGTYNLSVDGRIVDGSIASDGRYGTTGSPRLVPRIVAANVTTRYRSTDLTYRSEIRIVPGENGD